MKKTLIIIASIIALLIAAVLLFFKSDAKNPYPETTWGKFSGVCEVSEVPDENFGSEFHGCDYSVPEEEIPVFDKVAFNVENEFTVGDFRLTVNSENLSIASNNLSFFYIDGTVEDLLVGFYAGAGRFEGENLVAQNVRISQRSSNDIVVNPQLSLSGELRSTGDLISVTEPPIVDVERFYTGRLIFN